MLGGGGFAGQNVTVKKSAERAKSICSAVCVPQRPLVPSTPGLQTKGVRETTKEHLPMSSTGDTDTGRSDDGVGVVLSAVAASGAGGVGVVSGNASGAGGDATVEFAT